MFVLGASGRGSVDQNVTNEMIDDFSQRGADPPGTPRSQTFQCGTWPASAESVQ